MNKEKCPHCGRRDIDKSKYVLMGFVSAITFSLIVFSLGFYFKVSQI